MCRSLLIYGQRCFKAFIRGNEAHIFMLHRTLVSKVRPFQVHGGGTPMTDRVGIPEAVHGPVREHLELGINSIESGYECI